MLFLLPDKDETLQVMHVSWEQIKQGADFFFSLILTFSERACSQFWMSANYSEFKGIVFSKNGNCLYSLTLESFQSHKTSGPSLKHKRGYF